MEIKVTDEMRQAVDDWSVLQDADFIIKRIIELNEANKPKLEQTKNHDFLDEFVLNSMREHKLITGSFDNCGLCVLFSMGSLLSKSLVFVNSEKPWLQCDDERDVPSHLNWVLAKQGDHEALVRAESYQNERRFETLIPVPIGRFITNTYKELSVSEILTMLTQIKDSMIKHLSDDRKSIIEITYVDYVKLLLE